MQTRSSSRLVSNPSSNITPSTNLNPKGRNRRRSRQRIDEFNLDELSPLIVTMTDQRTMAQLLQAPTEGYEDAIVVPTITADNFELKHGLLTLVQNKHEAWDRFKDLLRACPHHGFSELHELDIFYNALNLKDQDSLNSAVGVSTNTSTSGISPDVAELKDTVKALLLDKKSQNQSPATVKTVEESYLQRYEFRNLILNSEPVTSLISEPVIAPVSTLKPNLKSSISYPPRRNDERNREKANNQIEKFYQIFKDMSFKISFADALILMPKFASTLKALIGNKEKLSEMARTPLNEHCFVVLLNKLPEKLGDAGKFLIPCDFSGMAECLALTDLGASINLMPFSV
nr:reverse transcriptase domain-containing protein [Tanacetum cinerariifolium]